MEIWKRIPLPQLKNMYEASNKGRIRSIKREVSYRSKNKKITKYWIPSKILKSCSSGTAKYKKVILSVKGITSCHSVHKLVALTFIKNPRNLKQINHKDGNKGNNKSSNLEWSTPTQNMIHARRLGLLHRPRGLDHPRCKFTKRDIIAIRKEVSKGAIQELLARQYKVSITTIYNIVHKKTYTDVK